MSHPKLFAAVAVTLAATIVVLAAPAPAAAQEGQEEALAYHAWFAANQTQDNAKAIEAAEAYLAAFPGGQYAEFLKKWLGPAQLTILNEAIQAGRVDEMITVGKKILANDPENLNVLYALAFQLRNKELLASPRNYEHADDAKAFAGKAVGLVEAGHTLAGVQTFDRDATLAWLYQVLAMVEANGGSRERTIELYEKSTSLAPQDPAVAARNLLELLSMRQSDYADAANAYNALPDEARSATEPSEEAKTAREAVDTRADALIDVAARFVVLADARGLPPATRDKVYGVLESVYKSRHPDDAEGAGLQGLLDSKK